MLNLRTIRDVLMHWEPSSFAATLFFPDKITQIKRNTWELDHPTLLPSDQINFLQPIPNLTFHTCELLPGNTRNYFLAGSETVPAAKDRACGQRQHLTQSMEGSRKKLHHEILHEDNLYLLFCANNPLTTSASSQTEIIFHPHKKTFMGYGPT